MGTFDPAKLYRTDETIAQLLEAAPEAMVLMSADGRIVRVNAQTEKLFGYSQEELVGQKPDLLLPPRRLKRSGVNQRARHVAHARLRPLGDGLEVLARRR